MKYDGTEVEQLTDNEWEDGGPRGTDRVSGKLNLLEKTTFYDFRVSDVYKCPVFGAKGNRYNVSEVKDRRDRSNELYEQVAALG